MNTNNILSNESRLKSIESRKKNLSPLFELNKYKQKRDRLEATKQKIELEISDYNKKIKDLLCQFGVCDLVKPERAPFKPYGTSLSLIINYLKEKSVPLTCRKIVDGIGSIYYSNTYALLNNHKELFEKLSDKTWKLKENVETINNKQ